jgi:hypothetical protein
MFLYEIILSGNPGLRTHFLPPEKVVVGVAQLINALNPEDLL